MDLKLIARLVRMMKRDELQEMEIADEKEGFKIRLKRGGPDGALGQSVVHVLPQVAGAAPPAMAQESSGAGAGGGAAGGEAALPPGSKQILSPMVGTFYRSPSPDQDLFVQVGDRVGEDTVLCIIEAMKVMNEIKAETEGEILEVLVENGDPVEYGQPLFLVKAT